MVSSAKTFSIPFFSVFIFLFPLGAYSYIYIYIYIYLYVFYIYIFVVFFVLKVVNVIQDYIQRLSPSSTSALTQFGQQFYLAPEARCSPPPDSPSYQVTPTLSLCLPLGPADCGVVPFAPSTSPATSHVSPVTAALQR